MDDGVHVYGQPIPAGYVPLSVEVEPLDDLWLGDTGLPATVPFLMEGLEDEFMVFEDSVTAVVPFTVLINRGAVTLRAKVRFQACTESVCFPPSEIILEVSIAGADHDLPVPPIANDSVPTRRT